MYQATSEPRFADIASSSRVLIFFGCPHRCLSTQDMEEKIARLVFSGPHVPSRGDTLCRVKSLAAAVVKTNSAFIDSKTMMRTCVHNIYSTAVDLSQLVFDEYTATLGAHCSGRRIGIPVSHVNLACASDHNSLWSEVRDIFDELHDSIQSNGTNEDVEAARKNRAERLSNLDIAVSLSAPVQFRMSLLPGQDPKWLTQSEGFTRWRDNAHAAVLVVEGPGDMRGLSEMALDAIIAHSREEELVSHFSFDAQDDQKNHIGAFIATTITQWLWRDTTNSLVRTLGWQFDRCRYFNTCTDEDLLYAMIHLRKNCWDDYGQAYFILDGLQQCKDMVPSFWDHIRHSFETRDYRLKFLIFTNSSRTLHPWLQEQPHFFVNQASFACRLDSLATSDLNNELFRLTAVRGNIRLLLANLRQYLQDNHGHDPTIIRLLLGQARGLNHQTLKESLETGRSAFPGTSISELMHSTMSNVPNNLRPFTRHILSWMLHAFRPLSISELQCAVANLTREIQPNPCDYLVTVFDEMMPGMFNLSDDKINFQHPVVRSFFEQASDVWYDVNASAHMTIAETCLEYLVSESAAESLSRICPIGYDLHTPAVFKPHDDLSCYAVEYWSRHYKEASDRPRLIHQAAIFFENKSAVELWMRALHYFTNPLKRSDDIEPSPTIWMAAMGLQDILDMRLKDEKDEGTYTMALRSAAANGHETLVKDFLGSVKFGSSNAELIMRSASAGGSQEIQRRLVARLSEDLPLFSCPPVVLYRASWLGQTELVRSLIDKGAEVDLHSHAIFGQNPLHYAARHNHLQVAEILIYKDKSLLDVKDSYGASALCLAVYHGHPDMVRLLLSHGAKIPPSPEDDFSLFTVACGYGNYAVVQILLDHGSQIDNFESGSEVTWPPLSIAAEDGFLNCMQALIAKGAKINHDGSSAHALRLAAENNHLEAVKLLVKHGASIDHKASDDDETALVRAIENGHIGLATWLIEAGADVNVGSSTATPLTRAALGKEVLIVSSLLEHQADVELVDEEGWTPLQSAYANASITRALLEAKADINRDTPQHPFPALFSAADNNMLEVVKVLLEFNPDIDKGNPESSKRTPLAAAVKENYADVARVLLEAGANINHMADDNDYIVHCAQDEHMLRTLMEFQPDLTVLNSDGDTALCRLLARSYSVPRPLTFAKILVNGRIDINKSNNKGDTPLMLAVKSDDLDIARFLLERRVDINLSTRQKGSALHQACQSGRVESVQLLVSAGANINQVHPNLGSPFHAACIRTSPRRYWFEDEESGIREILLYLQHAEDQTARLNSIGGVYGSALNAVCYHCSGPTIDCLLSAGAEIDIPDEFGRFPVHFAASRSVENLEKLREAGADFNQKDKSGRTIAHFAVQTGDMDLIRFTLEATGGDLDVKDCHGWTPLFYAARGCCHRYYPEDERRSPDWEGLQYDVVQYLTRHGSDLTIQTEMLDRTWSPLKIARYHGASMRIQELLKPQDVSEGEEQDWNDESHKTEKAYKYSFWCRCCLFTIHGVGHQCTECWDFRLCGKCYQLKDEIHPDHVWEKIGPEDEVASQPPSSIESSSDSDTDSL